jgi:hypothetical protein
MAVNDNIDIRELLEYLAMDVPLYVSVPSWKGLRGMYRSHDTALDLLALRLKLEQFALL